MIRTSTDRTSLAAVLDHAAPPHDHNPSSWRARGPIVALALTAAIAAGYLALYQWGLAAELGAPLLGERTKLALESEPAQAVRRWLGVPGAALAALAYFGAAMFCLVGSTRRWQYRPWLVLMFSLDVILLAISSLALAVAHAVFAGAWSGLYLAAAAIPPLLLALAFAELRATLSYLGRVNRRTLGPRVTWDSLWGRYDARAAEVCLHDLRDAKGAS